MSEATRPPKAVDSSAVDAALAEHRETMEAVREVENCLDQHPDSRGAWLGALTAELPRLAETLRCHFAEEQAGPLYRGVPIAHPRFAERLRELEAEHASILRSVEDTIDRARKLEARNAEIHDLREINAEVQLLVARIRRHEAEENEIILEAHWSEVGVGD